MNTSMGNALWQKGLERLSPAVVTIFMKAASKDTKEKFLN